MEAVLTHILVRVLLAFELSAQSQMWSVHGSLLCKVGNDTRCREGQQMPWIAMSKQWECEGMEIGQQIEDDAVGSVS